MFDSSTFASINQYGGVDYAPHNKGVTPVFFIEPAIDYAASEKAGRAIYVDMERVRIHIAGDPLSAPTHPVDKAIIERFQEAYDNWKRKGHVAINGTPLSKWPLATPSFIKEMEFLNIFSVDDLASVADVHLDRIADGRAWRDRAAAWLKSATDGAEAGRLREEVARLSAQVAELIGAKRAPMPEERKAKLRAQLAKAREAKKASAAS